MFSKFKFNYFSLIYFLVSLSILTYTIYKFHYNALGYKQISNIIFNKLSKNK